MDSYNSQDFNNGLDYNTERKPLNMPEYGRNVLKMVDELRAIPDRDRRSEQARAIVKVMELLNPGVRSQEDFEHKLWDHLYMMAGFDIDIDSPYPLPVAEEFSTAPVPIPMKDGRIKATHYGRNIEKIINLLCDEPEGEIRTEMIRSLAIYMRQQYLIWNKDNVADETIFADIEKLSDYRLRVPEGLSLAKISGDVSFSRPGLSINVGGQPKMNNNRQHRNNNFSRRPNNRKK